MGKLLNWSGYPVLICRGAELVAALALVLHCGCRTPGGPGDLTVRSPDGSIATHIEAQGALTYSVEIDGQRIVNESRLGLRFSQPARETLGADAELIHVYRHSEDQTWENRFGKRRHVRDHYNELRLKFREKSGRTFQMIFRAYDEGVAFRYVLPAESGLTSFTVESELTEFAFAGDYHCFAGEHEAGRGFLGPQE